MGQAFARDGRKIAVPAAVLFALRMTVGVILTMLGVVGLLLPILQGWMFFALATLFFFPRSRFTIATLEKIEPRMPRVARWLRRFGIGEVPARGTIRLR